MIHLMRPLRRHGVVVTVQREGIGAEVVEVITELVGRAIEGAFGFAVQS